ncbi:MAG: EI24 domain-containing protein [Mariprofundaceae bacterium]|nr:EI24 domain-containing protein [Mariprofundaceae bacterium]
MIKGMSSLLLGLRLLLTTQVLRSVLWRMLGLLAVLMLALMVGVFSLAEYVTSLWLPEGDAWYWVLLSWLVWILAILLALLTGVVSFAILGSAATAPWLDELAVQVELLRGYKGVEQGGVAWKQCLASLSNSARPLLGLLVWGCVALFIFMIPVIGPIMGTVIWTYAGIRFLCFELMDTTASREKLNFTARKTMLNERWFFWLGFGGLAMLLMMLPLLNLLVIPAAVVALADENDI